MQKLLSAALSALLAAAPAVQAMDEEAVIKYRQQVMKSASAHLKASGAILKGAVPFEGDLAKHARALADLGPMIATGFPEGSDFGDTDAKAEVWEKRDEFDKAAADFKRAAEAFAANPTGDTLDAVGKGCKGCHEGFREK